MVSYLYRSAPEGSVSLLFLACEIVRACCVYVYGCVSWGYVCVWYPSHPICSSWNPGHHHGHLPVSSNPSGSPVAPVLPRNPWNVAFLPPPLPTSLDDYNNSFCISAFSPSMPFPHRGQKVFLKFKTGHTLPTFEHPTLALRIKPQILDMASQTMYHLGPLGA